MAMIIQRVIYYCLIGLHVGNGERVDVIGECRQKRKKNRGQRKEKDSYTLLALLLTTRCLSVAIWQYAARRRLFISSAPSSLPRTPLPAS